MGLDGATLCAECLATGFRPAPAPLRPRTYTSPATPSKRLQKAEAIGYAIGKAVRESIPVAEQYARTAADVVQGVQRVRKALRKIPW